MNRMIQKLMLLLVMLVSAFGMNATPVGIGTAREVAVKFMNANTETPLRGTDDLQWVITYNISQGDAAFYVFNTPNGFVIVSADDCATPILGYSNEGQFDVNNIPIQLQDYLQGFVEQIEYSIENHLEADENTSRQWELVRSLGRLNENRDGNVVEPLITALWNQGCYYNAMCPEDPDGACGHALTGCVATAMGMILHYWGYPAHGTGSHTYTPLPYPTTQYPEQSVNFGETVYDWANMPDQLTDTSSQTEIAAVATLLWHCGVAVDMNYSPYGSGTDQHFTTLIDYFGYSEDLHWESRQDDESWLSLLKADLDLGRPVFYTGLRWATSGHAFVCDGYDVNDRFHFNWGWGGSSNGYFALNATMVFVYENEAIFNIHPNVGATCQMTQNLSFGSNWFSTYLDITLEDLQNALNAALPGATSITIKSKDGNCRWNGTQWRETGFIWDVAKMYRIEVPEDCEIILTGEPINPAEHPITIVPNTSTWIGFPLGESKTLDQAIPSGFAVSGDVIKSKDGNARYNGTRWRATGFDSLEPGKGYMYIPASTVTEDRILIYPTNAK